jgi:hypothetical protein
MGAARMSTRLSSPVFPERPKPRPEAHNDGGYFRVDLLDGELAYVIKVLRTSPKTELTKQIIERLELAELVDLPWTQRFQWEFAEAWAAIGYALPDQIADGFYATRPPEPQDQRELDAMGGE